MFGTVLRFAWRAIVGVVAAGLAYATFFLMYPYLDDRLPLLIVLIIIYVWVAYVGIPLLVRLWQLAIRPNHLPLYVTSGDGWSSDPVNLAVVCRDKKQLIRTMTRAGWYEADGGSIRTNLHLAFAVLFNRPYPTAPFSRLYLFGRQQDIGFQIPTGNPASPRHRHHVRFWQLLPDEAKPHHHQTFWKNIFQVFTIHKKQQIWVGAATHDIGPFAFRIRNFQITHQIDKHTDIERDFLLQTLTETKAIKRSEVLSAGDPLKFRGQTFGVRIITDGTLPVVELK